MEHFNLDVQVQKAAHSTPKNPTMLTTFGKFDPKNPTMLTTFGKYEPKNPTMLTTFG